MAACRSAIEWKTPRRIALPGHFGKEVLDGVEPGGRGRREMLQINNSGPINDAVNSARTTQTSRTGRRTSGKRVAGDYGTVGEPAEWRGLRNRQAQESAAEMPVRCPTRSRSGRALPRRVRSGASQIVKLGKLAGTENVRKIIIPRVRATNRG
jgi:hypothetical protein